MKKLPQTMVLIGWLFVGSLVPGLTPAQAPEAKSRQQNSTPCRVR